MIRKRNLETQLNELYDRKSKGAHLHIRSRAKWINEVKRTRYIFQVQKKHQIQNVIYELQNEKHEIVTDDKILDEI